MNLEKQLFGLNAKSCFAACFPKLYVLGHYLQAQSLEAGVDASAFLCLLNFVESVVLYGPHGRSSVLINILKCIGLSSTFS